MDPIRVLASADSLRGIKHLQDFKKPYFRYGFFYNNNIERLSNGPRTGSASAEFLLGDLTFSTFQKGRFEDRILKVSKHFFKRQWSRLLPQFFVLLTKHLTFRLKIITSQKWSILRAPQRNFVLFQFCTAKKVVETFKKRTNSKKWQC